jgi:ubiquinone/menaquinone biosynthesis C-methylase UbiE
VINATADPNLPVYNTREVAAHYAALDYLTPCEQLLFRAFLQEGMTVLDLGVGGGRTTPYLSSIARRYVGADYAEEMIAICRRKFPALEFEIADAADLALFPDGSFEAVIMAFNGMDYVIPDESRYCCLREIKRVLTANGVLIFSSHNPKAILVRPSWNRRPLEVLARHITGSLPGVYRPLLSLLILLRAVAAFVHASVSSLVRAARRVPTRVFWSGEGYILDSAHGGLRTHCATPERVEREVSGFGFRLQRVLGDDYPRSSRRYVTGWYYYVFTRVGLQGKERCA